MAKQAKKPQGRKSSRKGAPPKKRISRTRKPEEMSVEQWQIELRRQFGAEQDYDLKNTGEEEFFSEFLVTNPESGGTYRVAIRGEEPGCNYCSCPDFSVNTLGTCKHIEFTLAKLKRKRGAKTAFREGFRPPYSEVYLHYGAQRKVVFGSGADCPVALTRLAAQYFDQGGVLKEAAYATFDEFVKNAAQIEHEVRCYDDAIGFIAQVRDQQTRHDAIARAFPKGPDDPAFGKLLKVPLYAYQRQGALFAAQAGRCLVADDMGLGKTIQAIAAAEILKRTVGIERVLIVAPTSLKHQWQDEIARFSGRSAEVVQGLSPARRGLYETDSFYKITNYDVVFRDTEFIDAWAPDLIVLDEAQRIKNWQTQTAKAVKKLQSEYAFVLTGTPLQNRLEELHSIVEFVDRFRLGPLFRFLDIHQITNEVGRVTGYRNLSVIAQTLGPILVRRTKQEVLGELPERLDKQFFVPMTPQQAAHHSENQAIVARIVAKWRRYGFLSDADQRRLMIALQNMRMSCNSTYLLDQSTDHGVKADELVSLLEEIFEDPEAKAVVFSQWTRTHELVQNRLRARNWGFVFFHGGVPGPKRKDLIRKFKEDRGCRLFLSTDSGGVGLNLQNASVVINMDQPWNPAVLDQRIGRVHRLGQHRPVRVVDFISQGTIEEGMLSVISFKRSLFSGVLDGGASEVFLGGTRLKRFMESVEKVTDSIPAPALAQEESLVAAAMGAAAVAPECAPAVQPAEQAWADVAAAGLQLLTKLGTAMASQQASGAAAAAPAALSAALRRDDATGEPYLRIPVPPPDTLRKLADVLSALAGQGG